MTHDARGRPLAIGDTVVILATITQIHPTEDYCNVTLVSEFTRRPDRLKETISAINTGVLLRIMPGDYNPEIDHKEDKPNA